MPDQTFLPSLTDNKGPDDKQSAKMGAKKKSLRQRKVNGDRMFVSFPEVAKTIRVAKKTVKSFAVNSSSSKTSSLKTEDMSNRKKTGENLSDLNKDQLRKQLRLPSLVLTPTSERRMSEERWSNALGLRDRYEIPRGVNAFSLFISILVHCTVTLIKAVNQLRKNTHCGVECCVAFMTQMLGAGEHDADFGPGSL